MARHHSGLWSPHQAEMEEPIQEMGDPEEAVAVAVSKATEGTDHTPVAAALAAHIMMAHLVEEQAEHMEEVADMRAVQEVPEQQIQTNSIQE